MRNMRKIEPLTAEEKEDIVDGLYHAFLWGEEGVMDAAYNEWMSLPAIFPQGRDHMEAEKRVDAIFLYEEEVPDLGEWWDLYDELANFVYAYEGDIEGFTSRKRGNMRKSIDRIRRRQAKMRKAAMADSELRGYAGDFADKLETLQYDVDDLHREFSSVFLAADMSSPDARGNVDKVDLYIMEALDRLDAAVGLLDDLSK